MHDITICNHNMCVLNDNHGARPRIYTRQKPYRVGGNTIMRMKHYKIIYILSVFSLGMQVVLFYSFTRILHEGNFEITTGTLACKYLLFALLSACFIHNYFFLKTRKLAVLIFNIIVNLIVLSLLLFASLTQIGMAFLKA